MLITLITDFGYRDAFVGIMKGVIATINPSARVIDLTHGIAPQDVMAAALTLRHAVRYFPRGAIHVVVVDPGVGGERRPVVVESAGIYFIGPDNGALSLAAADRPRKIVQLTNPEYQLKATGTTFHGRDIFAPAAAHLSLGVPIDAFGHELAAITELAMPQVTRHENRLEGEILYIDGYGNLFTSITERDLKGMPREKMRVAIGSTIVRGLAPSYDAVAASELVAVVNSWGMLEVAAYKASARQKCNAKVGDKIIVTL